MGYRLIIRIMTVTVLIWMLLNLLVLRDRPYPELQPWFSGAFFLTMAVLFVLLYLNRYRP